MGILRLVVNKNIANDLKGNFFESFAAGVLTKLRYEVTQRVRFTGMEIDLIARHKDLNEVVYVECKFQSDVIGAGVITDLVGKAIIKGIKTVFLFTMSKLGKEAQGIVDEYGGGEGKPVKLVVYPAEKIYEIYLEQQGLSEPPDFVTQNRLGSLYCIVTPNSAEHRWVQVILRDGVPERGILLGQHNQATLSTLVRELADSIDQELSQLPLEVQGRAPDLVSTVNYEAQEEIISEISVADSFDDYRPCRPDDYVGRERLQQEIWEFLENVHSGTSVNRIITISGASGYGKSSTIIKLADRFKNRKWKGKFYLYDVDVRSARSPFYIHKSIRKAIEAARADGFILGDTADTDISNIGSVFQSPYLQSVLAELRKKNRVLVIFFDQFEELFTKVDLFGAFEMFRRLCHEVDSLKENVVLGFSWRTGISFNDSHPAYHMWHELADKRKDFQIRALSSLETSNLITRFENETLKQKLDKVVRRRIAEQSQGLPWLLKKLLVHLGKQIADGKGQNDLISGKFNVAPLFEEDLEQLNDIEVGCLKYIAHNSPIDLSTLTEIYHQDTVNGLYNRRLIIRSGHKYSVYWDIFRDFLNTGEVPNLPLTYIPKTTPASVKKILHELEHDGEVSFDELTERTGYTGKSCMNVVSDGLMFSLIQKTASGKYIRNRDLVSPQKLRQFLNLQLKEHSVIHELLTHIKAGEEPTAEMVSTIIDQLHTEEKFSPQSLRGYTSLILGWLQWASVLEVKGRKLSVIEKPDFTTDSPSKRRRGSKNPTGMPEFLGSSGPNQAIELLEAITSKKMSQEVLRKSRNSIADLRALGLIETGDEVSIDSKLNIFFIDDLRKELLGRANASRFIELTRVALDSPEEDLEQKYHRLIEELGSSWSHGSVLRYVNSARRWIREIDRSKT